VQPTSQKLRILHTVEFYDPSKGGAEEVVRQISERLALRGHTVTVATSHHPARAREEINGVAVRGFRIRGNAVKGIVGEGQMYQEFILSGTYDVIMNYGAQTWPTDAIFPLLDRIRAKKIIVPLGYSKLFRKKYSAYYQVLPTYLQKYDSIIYTSPSYRDKKFGDDHGINKNAVIIPNGADVTEFQNPSPGFRQRYNITSRYMFLSVSNHYFAKGHALIIEAIRELKRKDVTLVIIGERPQGHGWYSCYPYCRFSSLLDSRIKILRDVPREWVLSAFHEADLFLFGSQVECAPLVMYESFAARLPFVTTPVGNVTDHRDYLYLVENSRQMTRVVENFLSDPAQFQTIADHAYNEVARHHSWDYLTGRYQDIYEKLLSYR
jgi:glycosyltransferase involved in cell wall biosynthesis